MIPFRVKLGLSMPAVEKESPSAEGGLSFFRLKLLANRLKMEGSFIPPGQIFVDLLASSKAFFE